MKVYVVYDPFDEKVICVHDKPDMDCKICEESQNLYMLQEYEFEVQSGENLIPVE
jgi:hypothetical protein